MVKQSGVVAADLPVRRGPASGRYSMTLSLEVFALADREREARGMRTWTEYLIALLAEHGRELDQIFPSVGYDLQALGIGVVARRGYRSHANGATEVPIYLPRNDVGMRIAEVLEEYSARARSRSAFFQELCEHHLRRTGALAR